ncbi:MAG: hypothetical protein CBC48_01320, partial [bacterium TMED88]
MTKAGARRPKKSAKKAAVRKKATRKTSAKRTSSKSRAPEAVAVESAQPSEIDALLPEGKLYYRIGEVAKITHVKPHVLRYWETEFRWMAPPKSRSRQRLYRRKDIETILLIKRLLYDERYTIAGARQRLRELGLAKALEGAADATKASGRTQKTGTRRKASKATQSAGNSEGETREAAMLELRAGYR